MPDNTDKVLECRVGGKALRLVDLPMTVWAECEAETGAPWVEVFGTPMLQPVAGPWLLRKCAEILGVPAPDPITVKTLLAAFRLVDDDLPEVWEDGLPKAEAGQ